MLPAPGSPGGTEPEPWLIVHRGRILGLELARDGLAVRRQRVRLPVVELEPRGLADDLLGARDVADVRQADRDLVAAGGLDLGLGDAELVDALAHDVDGARAARPG